MPMIVQVQRNAAAPQLGDIEARQPRVFYKYHYHNSERHVVEKVVGYTCSFCQMACRSFPVRYQLYRKANKTVSVGFIVMAVIPESRRVRRQDASVPSAPRTQPLNLHGSA